MLTWFRTGSLVWEIALFFASKLIENHVFSSFFPAPIIDIQLVEAPAQCPTGYDTLTGEFFNAGYVCDCGANDIELSKFFSIHCFLVFFSFNQPDPR